MADEVEDLIEGLVKDFGEFKTKSKKEREELVAQLKEMAGKDIKELKEQSDKDLAELKTQVEKVNTEIAAKGATVNQLMEELEEFKKKKGRITFEGSDEQSTVSLLKDAFKENAQALETQSKKPKAYHEFELKSVGTMTASANLTGSVVASYAQQPALRGRRKLHIRDLIDVIPTATGVWKFYRQNSPVGEGSFDTQSTHGALKSQLDYDMTEVTITTDFLAGFVRIAKQMIADLPFMQSFVSQELVEDYLRAEDLKFFGQIYSGATGAAGASSSTVSVEKVIDYIAALGESDYEANGAVVTHAVWAKIMKTKPNDYSLPAGNAVTITANGDVMIVGVPIFRTNSSNIGNNMMLIGDWTKAKIIQSEGLSVNVYEQDSDNVQRNLLTIKAEARVALALLRPDAFIYASAGTT
jgi:HK97 family phage major capsid protein